MIMIIVMIIELTRIQFYFKWSGTQFHNNISDCNKNTDMQ